MNGKTSSHYRIIEKPGAGGMGAVYQAEDLRLHRISIPSGKAEIISSKIPNHCSSIYASFNVSCHDREIPNTGARLKNKLIMIEHSCEQKNRLVI